MDERKERRIIVLLISLIFIVILAVCGVIIYIYINTTLKTNSNINENKNINVYNNTNQINENATNENIVNNNNNNTIVNPYEDPSNNEYKNTKYKYYYNQLEQYSKLIYTKIEENIENLKTGEYRILLDSNITNLLYKEDGENILKQHFQSAWNAFSSDRPDIFYIDVSKIYLNIKSENIGGKTNYIVYMGNKDGENYYLQGFENKEQINEYVEKLENLKKQIYEITSEDTEFEKIKKIHDVLVNNLEYDETTKKTNNRNIYGGLIEKSVVCEGYAKTFKYVLDALNIPCVIIYGEGTNEQEKTESHSWNYVKINEKWYAVDVTWDDPTININNVAQNITISDKIKYKYFLKGSETFLKQHKEIGTITENGMEFKYPELEIKDYKQE